METMVILLTLACGLMVGVGFGFTVCSVMKGNAYADGFASALEVMRDPDRVITVESYVEEDD